MYSTVSAGFVQQKRVWFPLQIPVLDIKNVPFSHNNNFNLSEFVNSSFL